MADVATVERPREPLHAGTARTFAGEVSLLSQVEAFMVSLDPVRERDLLGRIVTAHLATGGKRVRARLALAAAYAFGQSGESLAPWAAACELLHNATLVHDDLQDGDRVRRGAPTTWALHGMPQAVNAGDLLLQLPYLAIDELDCEPGIKWQLARMIARRAAECVQGQSLEMELLGQRRFDRPTFDRMIAGKTGALMRLPVEGAALLAGFDAGTAAAIAEPFGWIGNLFQLQDDVLDLYGDKGRGAVGNDLREGKVSALVVEHLALVPEDTEWLTALLATPREQTAASDVLDAIVRFRASGALNAVIARIHRTRTCIEEAEWLCRFGSLHQLALDLIELTLRPIAHELRPAHLEEASP